MTAVLVSVGITVAVIATYLLISCIVAVVFMKTALDDDRWSAMFFGVLWPGSIPAVLGLAAIRFVVAPVVMKVAHVMAWVVDRIGGYDADENEPELPTAKARQRKV